MIMTIHFSDQQTECKILVQGIMTSYTCPHWFNTADLVNLARAKEAEKTQPDVLQHSV